MVWITNQVAQDPQIDPTAQYVQSNVVSQGAPVVVEPEFQPYKAPPVTTPTKPLNLRRISAGHPDSIPQAQPGPQSAPPIVHQLPPEPLPRSGSPRSPDPALVDLYGRTKPRNASSSGSLSAPPLPARPDMKSAKRALSQSAFQVFDFTSNIDGLKKIYKYKLRPLEENYQFDTFYSPCLNDVDIEARPMVLLLGQYSTGKTSFVESLLQKNYPGSNIGPEPTTDRFVAVMYGKEDRVIPGNAAAMSSELPFQGLSRFGTNFLSRFQVAVTPCKFLENVILIDTPGVLSGEKQRLNRNYDFAAVIKWFAERADMILLLFDAYKLDISDEFKSVIQVLRGHDDKIRVILNKSDAVSGQQLLRVFGAMMWNLGKVVSTPEVPRVYLGSFWAQPLKNPDTKAILEQEMRSLFLDLTVLPRQAAVRKVNEIVKRTKYLRVHILILSLLKKNMPTMFGKSSKQTQLLDTLPQTFEKISQTHRIPLGDFPDVDVYQSMLRNHKLDKFDKVNPRTIDGLELVLSDDLPKLLEKFPAVEGLDPSMLPGQNLQKVDMPTMNHYTQQLNINAQPQQQIQAITAYQQPGQHVQPVMGVNAQGQTVQYVPVSYQPPYGQQIDPMSHATGHYQVVTTPTSANADPRSPTPLVIPTTSARGSSPQPQVFSPTTAVDPASLTAVAGDLNGSQGSSGTQSGHHPWVTDVTD